MLLSLVAMIAATVSLQVCQQSKMLLLVFSQAKSVEDHFIFILLSVLTSHSICLSK